MLEDNKTTSLPDDVKSNNPLGNNESTPTDNVNNGEQKPGETDKEFKLRVKYNKEDRELTVDEAREYAQKGLNYDKVVSERDSIKNSKAYKRLERAAKDKGMTIDEYSDYLDNQEGITQVKNKYKIDDDEKAQEIYQGEKAKKIVNEQQEAEDKAKLEKEKSKKEVSELYAYYKDTYGKELTTDDIPQAVYDLSAQGMTLTEAFVRHKLNVLEGRAKVAEINNSNNNANPGAINNDGSGGTKEYTMEDISKMSQMEVNKLDPKIVAKLLSGGK